MSLLRPPSCSAQTKGGVVLDRLASPSSAPTSPGNCRLSFLVNPKPAPHWSPCCFSQPYRPLSEWTGHRGKPYRVLNRACPPQWLPTGSKQTPAPCHASRISHLWSLLFNFSSYDSSFTPGMLAPCAFLLFSSDPSVSFCSDPSWPVKVLLRDQHTASQLWPSSRQLQPQALGRPLSSAHLPPAFSKDSPVSF